MLWGQGRKIITNSRIAIGLDNMLRNYRNLKTNPSLRMQNFHKISWALFGEAIIRIGYEYLIYLHVTFREKLQYYHQYIKEATHLILTTPNQLNVESVLLHDTSKTSRGPRRVPCTAASADV